MRPRDIHFFFKLLDQSLNRPAQIILLGASAGALMGHIRPSVDIDFEIRLKKSKKVLHPEALETILQAVAKRSRVAVNYSEDVSHWSMISYLDYRRTAVPYKRIGKLAIKIMAPEYWTIGKMARFLDLDIQDMIKIIRIKKLKPQRLLKLWKLALEKSHLSLELGEFRRHVIQFVGTYGKGLWGRGFDPDKALKTF